MDSDSNSDGRSSPGTHGPHLASLAHLGHLHSTWGEFKTAYSKAVPVAINTLSADNTVQEGLDAQ